MNFELLNQLEFENFCKLLLTCIFPELQTIEGSGGDRGTDSFFGRINDQSTVFQFKFFTKRMTPSRWRQVRESLETSIQKRKPSKWVLLIPTEFTEGEHEEWEKLRVEFLNKNVTLEFWSIVKITEQAYRHVAVLSSAYPNLFPSSEVIRNFVDLLRVKPDLIFQRNRNTIFPNEDTLFVGRSFEVMKVSELLR